MVRNFLVLGLAVALSACGSKNNSDDKDTGGTGVVGVGGTSGTPIVRTGTIALSVESVDAGAGAAGLALTADGDTISFTPAKYLFPVAAITLSNSKNTNYIPTSEAATTTTEATTTPDGASPSTTVPPPPTDGLQGPVTLADGTVVDPNISKLYKCADTSPEKCRLDLRDNTAMKAAFGSPTKVPVGTYDTLSYDVVCTPGIGTGGGAGLQIGIQGTVAINGTTYYTTAKNSVLSADAADLGPALALITSCGGGAKFTLPAPVTVKDGETVQVSMFLAANNISWAGTAAGTPGLGGCVNGATSGFLCTSLPTVVPAAGSFSPAIELYKLEVSDQGAGQVGILADAKGTAIGAFLTRLYTPTEHSANIWDAGVVVFKKNDDGTYDIASGTDANAAGPRVEFPAFQRASHTGSLKASGAPSSYTATKQ